MRAISAPPRRPEQLMRMPLRAQAHRRLHRALHGAAEGDAALELLGDVLGDQLGVDLGLADLDDVQVHLALRHLREIACAASRCRRPSCRSPRPDGRCGS
jgi:hypothetical protein